MDILSEGDSSLKILSLNMRELPFFNVESFLACIQSKLSKWYEEIINSCAIKSKFFDVTLRRNRHFTLLDLLESMSAELPNWTLSRGCQIPTPILFIDEANKLRELVASN